ncbi:NUDIX domain-containing protein [Profundibacterium mesophilum]|uniref:ADP-ribose pyrophosphatase n=1 Tax=Profundibacterium mesophilum KAUST100406-0324 TaxID=1037889 RepID=A0A921NT37_9RHOB|nr:NUDIX domain-containing protein [Profundibacterium mesophilum]KAF0677540.1 Tellurite resistance protein [Profundibacterium mesophilum KAUST100406-0324]
MGDLFIFGTLCDEALRAIVLGRVITPERALLRDAAIFRAADGDWPVLVDRAGEQAEGFLLRRLGADELARLHFYEEGFDYKPVEAIVDVQGEGPLRVTLYRPAVRQEVGREAWSLAAWQEGWGAMTRRAAREAMALHGRIDGAALRARMPTIRTRADAFTRAARSARPEGTSAPWSRDDVDLLAARQPYANYFAVDESEIRHPLFGGGTSPAMTRAAWLGGDAVTVLPYDPRSDRVHLVEQFRFGPYARGDLHPWILEPIAGRIDPGEDPQDTARREAREEAGLSIGRLIEIGAYYPSPGALSEHTISYVGLCALPREGGWTGGADVENEDIRSHVITFARLMELLSSGALNNGPLLISALWLARERGSLRDVG